MNTYKLKKGASIPDFKQAVERLVKEILANHKGAISFKLLSEGDALSQHSVLLAGRPDACASPVSQGYGWVDCITWETMDDYNAFLKAAESNPTDSALAFYAFLNMNSCKSHVYTVELDMEARND